MKRCSRCRQGFPLAAFHKCTSAADGLQNNCKSCRAAFAAAAKPQTKVRHARWYQANKADQLAASRQWKVANPEQTRTMNRESAQRAYAADPQKFRDRAVAWNKAHPDRVWLRDMKRRAKKWKVETFTATYQDWLEILEAAGHRCHYCGAGGKMHTEHRVPFARRGQHTKDNIVPACHRCNVQKNQLTDVEFREVLAQAA